MTTHRQHPTPLLRNGEGRRRSSCPAAPFTVARPSPRAQLVVAGGIGAGAAGAGPGWGIGQAFDGIAALSGSSALVVIAALLLLAKFTGR